MRILTLKELKASFPQVSPEVLAEAHALAELAFISAELQTFTEEGEPTPMEVLLEELEEAQRQFDENSE